MAKEKKKDKEAKKEETKDKKATKTKRAKSKAAEEAEPVKALDKAVKAKEGEIVEKTPAEKAEEEAEEKVEGLKEDKEPSEEAKVLEEEAEAPAEEEEELEIVEEKFYNLNLRKIWSSPREKRTPRAVRFLRDYVSRHMKTDEVAISEEANSMLWKRGISKPPRKIRVRAVKDKDGRVIVFPGEVK